MTCYILHFARLSHHSLDIVEVLDNQWLQSPVDEQLVLEYHAAQSLIHWCLVAAAEYQAFKQRRHILSHKSSKCTSYASLIYQTSIVMVFVIHLLYYLQLAFVLYFVEYSYV